MANNEKLGNQDKPDRYHIHLESCKECQQLSPCKVGHDILLELHGWKAIKNNA